MGKKTERTREIDFKSMIEKKEKSDIISEMKNEL